MLRCQNETGITLARARSEAIHCTTKREKKKALPSRPTASQSQVSFQSMGLGSWFLGGGCG